MANCDEGDPNLQLPSRRAACFRPALSHDIRLHELEELLLGTSLGDKPMSIVELLGCSIEEFTAGWNENRKPENYWEKNPVVSVLFLHPTSLAEEDLPWVVDPMLDEIPPITEGD